MTSDAPRISDPNADTRFRELAAARGLDPDSPWVGGYVSYEWTRSRHSFEVQAEPVTDAEVLEVGCNFGATAIVLATLGAKVTAVDVDNATVELAKENAARYGLSERIIFLHVDDTATMPFPSERFDIICCNSVLEYVPDRLLRRVQAEINRVLKPGGTILVLGTSNRLWPREGHTRKWFINYLPSRLDSLFGQRGGRRGIFPWQVRFGFGPCYDNLDRVDRGRSYLAARQRMNPERREILRRAANSLAAACGVSLGLLTPWISLTLKKRK